MNLLEPWSHCSYWFKEVEVCKKKKKESHLFENPMHQASDHCYFICTNYFKLHNSFIMDELYAVYDVIHNKYEQQTSFVKRLLCLGILATSICSDWKQKERGREEQGICNVYTLHVNKVSAVIFNAFTSILCLICQQIRYTQMSLWYWVNNSLYIKVVWIQTGC